MCFSKHAETKDTRVYHTKSLTQNSDGSIWDLRTVYVVYGELTSPTYRIVYIDKIEEVANVVGSCWRLPEGETSISTLPRYLTKDEVLRAKKVVATFQRDDEDQPDVIIVVGAAELARLQYDTSVPLS